MKNSKNFYQLKICKDSYDIIWVIHIIKFYKKESTLYI